MWQMKEKHALPKYVNMKKELQLQKFRESLRKRTRSEISKYATGVKLDRK